MCFPIILPSIERGLNSSPNRSSGRGYVPAEPTMLREQVALFHDIRNFRLVFLQIQKQVIA